jgi:hypothetical protein
VDAQLAIENNIVAPDVASVHIFAIAVLCQSTNVVRMNLLRIFREHPASVGETYTGHLLQACGFGLRMVISGLACLVHAFLPFLFARSASDCVSELHATLTARRGLQKSAAPLRCDKVSGLS